MAARSFELQRELGDGAFGTVYLADMVSLGGFRKSVAVKLLKPDWDAASDAARRLRDEARLLGRLRHRHIVQVDDLIRLDGRWAVVMEYVPGVDLEHLVHGLSEPVPEGSLPPPGNCLPPVAALEITAAVAQALDAAWNGAGDDGEALRVVHRDIKPSNIRLTADGDLKVLDFGIARAEFQGREAKTDKIRYGSIGYMSPERLLGDPEVPAGDVYAVGSVLYELLTGQAFGRTKLAPQKADQQLKERLDAAQSFLGPDLTATLELIRDCMAYDVEDRPDATEVALRARALSRTLDGEDVYAYSLRVVPEVAAATQGRTVTNRLLTEEIDSQTFAMDPQAAANADAMQAAPGAPQAGLDSPLDPTHPIAGSGPLAPAASAVDALQTDAPQTPPIAPRTGPTLAHQLGDGSADSGGGLSVRAIGIALFALLVLTMVGSAIVLYVLGNDSGVAQTVSVPQSVRGTGNAATTLIDEVETSTPPTEAVGESTDDGVPLQDGSATELGSSAPEAASTDTSSPPAAVLPASTAAVVASPTGPAATSSASTANDTATPASGTAAPAAAAAPEATAATAATAATVDRVKFHVKGASRVVASCGSVSNSSTSSSVNLRSLPAGACSLRATVDGEEHSTTVRVDRPNGYTCTPDNGKLTCISQL